MQPDVRIRTPGSRRPPRIRILQVILDTLTVARRGPNDVAKPDDAEHRRGSQTAGRALQLLQIMAETDKALGLAELARLTELNKSAVYRLMLELERRAFVTREAAGRRYVVGPASVSMAAHVMHRFTLRSAARPMMQRIAELTPETMSLHVRYFQQRICIEVIEGRFPVRRVVPLGETLPLWAGPSGKAILAYLPEGEAQPILEWAVREGQNATRIREQLDQVRILGYLETVSDRIPGVTALSVPVFDAGGVVAALSISGPSDRLTAAALEVIAPTVVAECASLSRTLGFIPALERNGGNRLS